MVKKYPHHSCRYANYLMAKGAVKMSNKFPAKGQIKPIEVSVDAVTNKASISMGKKHSHTACRHGQHQYAARQKLIYIS